MTSEEDFRKALDDYLATDRERRKEIAKEATTALEHGRDIDSADPHDLDGLVRDVDTLINMLIDVTATGAEPTRVGEELLFGIRFMTFLNRVARKGEREKGTYEVRIAYDGVVVAGERGTGSLREALLSLAR